MQDVMRQLGALGELQRRLLPRFVPQLSGWSIAVHYAVGRWPGGDYYDFLELPDGRLFIIVADASDQGAPSSALVAIMRVLLHSCPLSSGVAKLPFCPFTEPVMQPPHILLGHLNRVLVENSLEEQFVTAFGGVLEPVDGEFHYANAGHPPPRWWRRSTGAVESVRDATGLPLGMDHRASYHHRRVDIEPGDIFLFYSDGLTAAANARGQMFGCDRLDAILKETADQVAEAVKSAVLIQFEDFLGGREPEDDVTLVVLQRLDSR